MELPFLKNKKKNQGGGGPVEEISREPDSSSAPKLIEMVADELMDSYHRGDNQGFLHALRAFLHLMKEEN